MTSSVKSTYRCIREEDASLLYTLVSNFPLRLLNVNVVALHRWYKTSSTEEDALFCKIARDSKRSMLRFRGLLGEVYLHWCRIAPQTVAGLTLVE